jgi:hypothetical protein
MIADCTSHRLWWPAPAFATRGHAAAQQRHVTCGLISPPFDLQSRYGSRDRSAKLNFRTLELVRKRCFRRRGHPIRRYRSGDLAAEIDDWLPEVCRGYQALERDLIVELLTWRVGLALSVAVAGVLLLELCAGQPAGLLLDGSSAFPRAEPAATVSLV